MFRRRHDPSHISRYQRTKEAVAQYRAVQYTRAALLLAFAAVAVVATAGTIVAAQPLGMVIGAGLAAYTANRGRKAFVRGRDAGERFRAQRAERRQTRQLDRSDAGREAGLEAARDTGREHVIERPAEPAAGRHLRAVPEVEAAKTPQPTAERTAAERAADKRAVRWLPPRAEAEVSAERTDAGRDSGRSRPGPELEGPSL